MRNKLIHHIIYAIFSIPFGFWYWAIIVAETTHHIKLVSIGFLTALHILFYVFILGAKKTQ